jgi:hypothetical protein
LSTCLLLHLLMLIGDLGVDVALIMFLVSAVVVPKEAHPRHGRRVSREIVQPNMALGATMPRRSVTTVLAAASVTSLWLVFAAAVPLRILSLWFCELAARVCSSSLCTWFRGYT